MCGIFGGIGNLNSDKLRILALLNEERGQQSFGIYSDGIIQKGIGLISDSFNQLKLKGSLYIGHTRQATQGKVITANCHPFTYGNIIGSHNGIISNDDKYGQYNVDSEVIFDLLNKDGLDGLKKLSGYWGLAWVNRKDKRLYLAIYNNTLEVIKTADAIYFTSDDSHMKKAGIKGNRIKLKDGEVISFGKDLKVKRHGIYQGQVYKPTHQEYSITAGKDWYTQNWYTQSYWLNDSQPKETIQCQDCGKAGAIYDYNVDAYL